MRLLALIFGALAGGLVEFVVNDFIEKWLPPYRRSFKHYIAIGIAIITFFAVTLLIELTYAPENTSTNISFDDNYGTINNNPTINQQISQSVQPNLPQDVALQKLYNDQTLKFSADGTTRTFDGYEIRLLLAEPYTQNQILRYVLLTSKNPPDNNCHICAPSIDGAIFSLVGNEWQTTIEQQGIVTYLGSFGYPPPSELVQIGPDKWGFQFNWTYLTGGIFIGGVTLISHQAAGFQVVLESKTYEYVDCIEPPSFPCYDHQSTMSFTEGSNPNYYDIIINTSGTRLNDSRIAEQFNENITYTFSIDKYVPKE